jgi:hypothetical protein
MVRVVCYTFGSFRTHLFWLVLFQTDESIEPDHTYVDGASDYTESVPPLDPNDIPNPTLVNSIRLKWLNLNYEIVSRLCSCLSLSDRDCNLLLEELHKLDTGLPIPVNLRDLRKAEQDAFKETSFHVTPIPVEAPRTKAGHLMVEEATLSLIHKNIVEAMEDLVNIAEHVAWVVWNFEYQSTVDGINTDDAGTHRIVSELNTAEWWRMEEEILPGDKPSILACILNCDETPVTMTGRKVHPVYATCGNLPRWFRQKSSGWVLNGFIPVVRSVKAYKNSVRVRTYRRLIKRWCMGMLLKPVIDLAHGFYLRCKQLDGSVVPRWVYPRFPFLIADEPEMMHTAVGGYGSTQSRMPCSNCDVVPKLQGVRTRGRFRDINVIKAYMCPITQTSTMPKDISKHISIHREFSWMPFVPGFDPFRSPADRMHQFDHGIFVTVKELIVACVKLHYSPGSLEVFDRRWSWLSRLPGTKLFKRGISSLAFVACFENRIMAMGLPFVLRGMSTRLVSTSVLPHDAMEDLAMTYLCVRWLVGNDTFTQTKMDLLRALCVSLQDKIDAVNTIVHGGPIDGGIKFHKLIHWADYISLFGCTSNWNTETFESAHKVLKRWKKSLSYYSSACAGIRLMRQMCIRDGHTDGHTTAHIDAQKKKGWGHGGFKGFICFQSSRGLSSRTIARLIKFERGRGFGMHAVEDLHDAYVRLLPSHSHDIAMLSSILNTSDICLNFLSTPPACASDSCDPYALTFFWANSHNAIKCWRKTFCEDADAYVTINRDIIYSHISRQNTQQQRVGRLRWACSLPNTRQFLVIQRMREISTEYSRSCGDDSDVERKLTFLLDTTKRSVDIAKMHCRSFRLEPPHIVTSYDVIPLGYASSSIDGLAMLQPDFSENIQEDQEHTRYFMMPYIIQ